MDVAVLVQVINVEWTKLSRGGKRRARYRNSVPSALPIPDDILERWTGETSLDTSHWSEANDSPSRTAENSRDFRQLVSSESGLSRSSQASTNLRTGW